MRITLLLNTASSGNGHLEMATFVQQQIANLPGQMYKWPHSSNGALFAHWPIQILTLVLLCIHNCFRDSFSNA